MRQPTTRACNVCRQKFPRIAEFWHKQPRFKDGFSETCKECAKKRTREWYAANRDPSLARKRAHYLANADRYSQEARERSQAKREKESARKAAFIKNNPEVPARACKVCDTKFPLTADFWYADPRGRSFHGECKDCEKARIRAWRRARPEKEKLYHERSKAKAIAERNGEAPPESLLRPLPTHRACSRCQKDFERTVEFWHRNISMRDGLSATCRQCAKERAGERYLRVRVTDAEAMRERNRAFYLANREKVMARTTAARERRKATPGRITRFDIGVQFGKQNGLCFYCNKSLVAGRFDVDHYIPISKGGTNDPSNIVIACPTCNNSKHDKLPSEFNPQ